MQTVWYVYFPLIIFLILLFRSRKITGYIAKVRIKRRNGDIEMQELAKRLIGKDVLIKLVGGEAEDGIIKEVTGNACVLEKPNGGVRVLNLDYVVRVREYPLNKNGKRKQFVFD